MRSRPMHSSTVITLDITRRTRTVNHRLRNTVHRILSNIILAVNLEYSRRKLL